MTAELIAEARKKALEYKQCRESQHEWDPDDDYFDGVTVDVLDLADALERVEKELDEAQEGEAAALVARDEEQLRVLRTQQQADDLIGGLEAERDRLRAENERLWRVEKAARRVNYSLGDLRDQAVLKHALETVR